MRVKFIGNSLMQILPGVIGQKINEWFDVVRPLLEFKFDTVSKLKKYLLRLNQVLDRLTRTGPC